MLAGISVNKNSEPFSRITASETKTELLLARVWISVNINSEPLLTDRWQAERKNSASACGNLRMRLCKIRTGRVKPRVGI